MIIKKVENCIYCGKKMESITAKKRFCSDTCRVYYNRQKSETNKSVDDLMNLGIAVTKTFLNNKGKVGIKRVDPLSKEAQAVIYNSEHTDSKVFVEEIKLSEYELRMAKERVEVLRKEIANPPPNPMIGKKKYLAIREKELNELLSKLK